ncbi:MAG: hypothetical protein XD87_0257 [candidate division WS6 bacterium 36_33]|uniref:DUF192 domain-containing protein n=1 Tax=candidate division WS6 bacterium 36_33 TaxID=1641388 RepID=A0A101GYV5_9BACT|nr:MAG: hypothetical protein XD87_0257 [candidate division WS6 bacterium 36_33]
MNNQLKLLLYIVFIAGAIFYVQDSFGLLDISIVDNKEKVEENEEEEQEKEESIVKEIQEEEYVEISIGEGDVIKVNVEVADTQALRTLGLSNRRYLGDYDGMLFLFDENVNTPFWMKDTFINLDIIFIDENGFIVDIKENNEPCRDLYCPQILSDQEFRYVLEVNGGFANTNGVKEGQSVTMNLVSKE